MGSSASSPLPLAPTFQRMSSYELKHAKRMLQDYKDKDLDFGLDAQALSELLAGDKEWSAEVIDAFGSTNGIVNALAFICGVCMVCPGSALEKAGLVFDALDFDATEQLSMDEMTIVFLCATRGFVVLSGMGAVPSDDDLESITLRAYRELNKSSGQSISKAEFTKWVLRFASAGGVGGDMTRSGSEVTIESALEQFGVVAAPKESSPVHQDELKAPSDVSAGNNELASEFQGGGDQQVDVELMDGGESAFDASYQAHGDNEANADEESYFTEADTATEFEASPEEGTAVAFKPEVQLDEAIYSDEAAPDHEQSFEAQPTASTDEQEEHKVLEIEPEEIQEYEQEFAPETPRNADSAVAVKQVYDEEQAVTEADDLSPEADLQVDRSPSPEPSSDEPLASSEPQRETDLIVLEAQIANAIPPAESNLETSDEQVPADYADDHDEDVTMPPSDEVPEFEAVVEAVSAHEAEADYENYDYDLPSAREDEDGAAEFAAIEKVDTSAESEAVEPPPAEQGHDETIPESVSEPSAAAGVDDVDLNDFEAYDYEDPEFDASSGLPPTEDPADYADTAGDPLADDAVDDGVVPPVVDEAPAADVPVDVETPVATEVATAETIPTEEASVVSRVPVDDEAPAEAAAKTLSTGEVSAANDISADDEVPGGNVGASTGEVPAAAAPEDESLSAPTDLQANEEEENDTTSDTRHAAEVPTIEDASAAPKKPQQSEEV